MEKVLITGGTGFVGRYVVNLALKKGYAVHLLVRNLKKAKNIFGGTINCHVIENLTEIEKLRDIIKILKPDYVIHLIGIIQEIKSKGITFEKVHFEYSKYFYEVLKELPPKKIIHMSALGVDEKAPSKYHITKLKAEKELLKSGIPFVIFRPSFILGPEQLLFTKLREILNRAPFIIFPDINGYYFQPVDVRDVAECFIRAIEYNGTGVFELCGDEKVSLSDIVRDFLKVLHKVALFFPIPKGILKIFLSEQYKMMWRDNVCGYSKDIFQMTEILQKSPIPYIESIKWSATNK
jgi:NADH dehydrogenase